MEEIDNSVIRIFRVTDRDEKFMIKTFYLNRGFLKLILVK